MASNKRIVRLVILLFSHIPNLIDVFVSANHSLQMHFAKWKNCIADLVFISFHHYKLYVYLELGKQIVNKVFFCLVLPRYLEINEVSIGVSFSEELRNALISSSNKLGKYLIIVLGTLKFQNKKNNFKFLTAYIAFAISLKKPLLTSLPQKIL